MQQSELRDVKKATFPSRPIFAELYHRLLYPVSLRGIHVLTYEVDEKWMAAATR